MKSWYIGVERARICPSHPMMAPRSGSITLLMLDGRKYGLRSLSTSQNHCIPMILTTKTMESPRKNT